MKLVQKKKKASILYYLTDEALREVATTEAKRPVSEMDANLITQCSEILNERHEAELKAAPKKRIPKKAIKRTIAIAAVISLLAASLTFVFADSSDNPFNLNHIQFVEYTDHHLYVDYDNIDAVPDGYYLPDTELLTELKKSGIEPLLLPECFVNGEYEISNIKSEYHIGDPSVSYRELSMEFAKGNITGEVSVEKNDLYFFLNQPSAGSYSFFSRRADEIIVNGLDVLLVRIKKSNLIIYFDRTQNSSYRISVNGTYKQAKEILESIK